MSQIKEVWGLTEEVIAKISNNFELISSPSIKKININEAEFKQVLAVPYIDYELTKKIFNYKNDVIVIHSIEELKKIDGFPLDKFNRIALYLEAN